jgi:FkbM family methyltransferase
MKLTTMTYQVLLKFWALLPFKIQIGSLLRRSPTKHLSADFWIAGLFKVNYFDTSFKLYGSKEDKITQGDFWKGLANSWDAQSIHIWGKLAKKSSVILDIGSNIGLYSLAAKTIHPTARVIAFEPSKKIIPILERNIRINKLKIELYRIVLSDFYRQTLLYDLIEPTAIASLKKNEVLENSGKLISYDVEVQAAEQFVLENNIDQVDLISIDFELNELEVLKGMKNKMQKWKPTLIVEVLNDEIRNNIQVFFDGLDYLYFSINERKGLTVETKKHRKQNDYGSFNYLICQRNIAKELNLIQRI